MVTNEISTGKGLLLVAGIIGALVAWQWHTNPPPAQQTQAAQQAAKAVNPTWRYSNEMDEMTGKAAQIAALKSTSVLMLDFPYQGPQQATLTLRRHPRHGFDSIVSIDRGQLQCGIGDGCKLTVRFDDTTESWTFIEPQSHDTTMLFLRDGLAFAKRVQTSKVVRIELKFFQQQPSVVVFDVAGLKGKLVGV